MATWKKIITSGSSAELSSLTLDTALPVAQGGIGATSLTDKAVLISQDSGTDAIGAVALTSNGQIIIGGSDGPAAATIGGTNNEVEITNGANSIQIGLPNDVTIGQDLTVTRNISNASAVSDSHLTGSFTGSFTGDGSNLTGVAQDIDTLSAGSDIVAADKFLYSNNGTEESVTFAIISSSIFENISGDATIAAGGALTIANNAVETDMISDDQVTNAKLANIARGSIKVGGASDAPTDLDAKTSGQILVGSGTDIASVAVSGDMTLASDGTLTIDDNAVDNDAIDNTADVTLGSLTTTNNIVVGGDLTVNGTTTTVATTNTKVEDQLMFLGTGSAATPKDIGIIAQSGSADLSGSAFYHDVTQAATTNPNGGRWSVAKGVKDTADAITPLQFVTTVKTDTVNPDSTSGSYGAGEMHVNTTSGEIWIRGMNGSKL